MSEKTIRVGDLVMVIAPSKCCNGVSGIGRIHIATGIYPKWICNVCEKMFEETCVTVGGELLGYATYRLIKIDPPALGEYAIKDEVIHV